MNSSIKIFVFLTLFTYTAFGQYPTPNHRQLIWQNAEIAVVFHYDLHVADLTTKAQHHRYKPQADHNIFSPKKLDTDQWIRVAKSMGTKLALLTVTHETGFALYQSKVNPYCMKALEWQDGKGDIVRDFVESCRKYDVLPGLYFGLRWNAFYGVHNFKAIDEDEMGSYRQEWYNSMVEGMLEELFTNYGELAMIWFDGGASHPDLGAPDVIPIWKKYQPNCIFYHNDQYADIRYGGSESGQVPYPSWSRFPFSHSHSAGQDNERKYFLKHGDQDGEYWMPSMSDAPLRGHDGRHDWFWVPDANQHIEPLEDLMEMYYGSVGHNSTLMLGLTPNADGLMPKADSIRIAEFGEKLKSTFSDPIASTKGEGDKIILSLDQNETINHIILMEDIVHGERVREFVVEGHTRNGWEQIYSGTNIGHKHIARIQSVEVSELRLIIQKSIDTPLIKKLEVLNAPNNIIK